MPLVLPVEAEPGVTALRQQVQIIEDLSAVLSGGQAGGVMHLGARQLGSQFAAQRDAEKPPSARDLAAIE